MVSDLLIRGARIVDGTGAPWFLSDVRIGDGRITSIGPSLRADGSDTLDADGRYLAPGFIDARSYIRRAPMPTQRSWRRSRIR